VLDGYGEYAVKPTKDPTPAKLVRREHGNRTTSIIVSGEDAPAPTSEELQNFQNYAEYSKTLRAWLVAYGIGGPVLFFTNQDLTQAIANSPNKRLILALFLIGVSSQVLLAFLNKWCAWHIYAGENDRKYRDKLIYRVWAWINDQSVIDFAIDAISLVAFAYSTWLTLKVFV
jgi:hypothetical protein